MRFGVILISMVATFGVTAFADDDLSFVFGPVTTTVVQGELALQNTDAIIVSSDDDVSLPYSGVHVAVIYEGSGPKFRFSVVERRVTEQLSFTTVEAVRASPILIKDDKRKLEALINANAERVLTVGSFNAEELTSPLFEEVHQQFLNERNAITEKYKNNLRFTTIALGIRNALIQADELSIHSLSVSPLGYGLRSELTLTESVAAILTGVHLYEMQLPNSKEHDLRIVVNEKANPSNRKKLIAKLVPVLQDGEFVQNAARSIRHSAIGADAPKPVAAKASPRLSRIGDFCRKILTAGRAKL